MRRAHEAASLPASADARDARGSTVHARQICGTHRCTWASQRARRARRRHVTTPVRHGSVRITVIGDASACSHPQHRSASPHAKRAHQKGIGHRIRGGPRRARLQQRQVPDILEPEIACAQRCGKQPEITCRRDRGKPRATTTQARRGGETARYNGQDWRVGGGR